MAYYDNIPQDGFSITPNDDADLPEIAFGLYIGASGDVSVITAAGTPLFFAGAQAGSTLPYAIKRVLATGTSAAGLNGAKMI